MKDLTGLALRSRTYLIRIGYAIVLMLVSFLVLVNAIQRAQSSLVLLLGTGRPVLQSLVVLQEFGLYLILPVLASSAIAVEKERRTLDLLLITSLGTWAIVCQKFLSVLIVALNFLLLSLPILAFCYALGGIEPSDLMFAVLELVLTSVRLTAVGLACSAICNTSGRALALTYLMLSNAFLAELVCHVLIEDAGTIMGYGPYALYFHVEHSFVDPGLGRLLRSNLYLSELAKNPQPVGILVGCLSSLFFSLIFLPVTRAFLTPPAWLRKRRSDRLATQHIRLAKNERTSQFDDPISWREAPRGNMMWWWIKRCLQVSIPVIAIMSYIHLPPSNGDPLESDAVLSLLIWLIVSLTICAQGSTLFVAERVYQTLDILRCTPLSAVQIVKQKMESLERTVCLCRVALGTCAVFRVLFNHNPVFIIGDAIIIWIYPQVMAWMSVKCGATARSGANAILKSILVLCGWCLLTLPLLGVSPLPALLLTEYLGIFRPADPFRLDPGYRLLSALILLVTPLFQRIALTAHRETVLARADSWIRTVPLQHRVSSSDSDA